MKPNAGSAHRAATLAGALFLVAPSLAHAESARIRIAFGHQAPPGTLYSVALYPASPGLEISNIRGLDLESDDHLEAPILLRAGGGDIDTLECDLRWPHVAPRTDAAFPFDYDGDAMWKYLFAHGSAGQVARLQEDPALTPGAPILSVHTAADGARGFGIGLDQLRRHRAVWLPEHHAYLTLGDDPVPFTDHLASLSGQRTLDRIRGSREATFAEFASRWEDMGDPNAWHPSWETSWLGARGHIVPLAGQHGSIFKFGIDRWAGIRPDRASPHLFRFDLLWPDSRWLSQRLTDGLPVLVTRLERNGQICEIEQFACPLDRTRPTGGGEDPMVFLTRATFSGAPGPLNLGFRLATQSPNHHPHLVQLDGRWAVLERETGRVWLLIEPGAGLALVPWAPIDDANDPRVEFQVVGNLDGIQTFQVTLKLPSPAAAPTGLPSLHALDHTTQRAATLRYWEDWLAQGARFEVPEANVNDLFRANLWHALRLPRFRVQNGRPRIDLPYSNFAYGQLNADWPINQAVYVDYMIYGLRGHFDVAHTELAAMFQSQQQPNGRIGGYADWGVYSPSFLYSIAQNYLLSGDRDAFDLLLPPSLRTLDWCLAELGHAQSSTNTPGLIHAPLNDLTHEPQAWAFPNAYFVAGLAFFGRALEAHGHPRAAQCRDAARQLRRHVEREFARASVRSPAVQLADGTWNNFVPSAATLPRRLFDHWYPTDVDTGPLHLARLEAINPRGWLATAMLHDHEDNLFLKQWGAANEPVYNPQGTAYLLRDEPEAAIRTFYSTMASAFSHHQLEPVEHRWAWGQYFGPPSTDGAWFHLYRHLLIRETGDRSLLLCQATPRQWLQNGNRIRIERAPTHFGTLNFRLQSQTARGLIQAELDLPARNPPDSLFLRFRHPERHPMRAVTVNGRDWTDFDPDQEWIRIAIPRARRYSVVARYAVP
jgi:hypothetical protein